ncbi:FAD-dependent monooxygenase [Actinomadura sp. NAK00032]|uniref:FAD-dependent monooxygenase n=1 Tax=Actinomadura sp. NAK00032 TaxID=2742128 RepID=UPI0015903DBB|nr:FAD-dependent monooxygenase [Actinomadura sp. NAK00032]QKW38190.1 FAD-dependent monooxygenase [Actinomadura sp. NAK00032]
MIGVDGPRVAIVGGGIGGLAASAFLRREGIPATVYEQASQLREVGAGLVVAPNTARLLRRLGVLDAFAARAVRLDVGWEFRRWRDGTVLSAEDLASACERLYGEHTYTAHRADLLDVLRSLVPGGGLRLGEQCVEVTVRADGRPVLRFAGGESVQPDVVIGADGIHSVVRGAITASAPATYSGICAFRALVPSGRAPAFARRSAQTLWIGPDHHLVHYPVSAGRSVNLVAFAPARDDAVESWTATATVEEFLHEFEGWDPRLTALIRAAGTPGRWALLDRAPLRSWSEGAVTLLGDAAHPMFPFFAQGAAQAIEDAAVLARCLADDPADPPRALRRYERLRIPRTTRLQEVSHARSHVNHLPDGPEQQARDDSFADADPLVANAWIYDYDPDDALARTSDT